MIIKKINKILKKEAGKIIALGIVAVMSVSTLSGVYASATTTEKNAGAGSDASSGAKDIDKKPSDVKKYVGTQIANRGVALIDFGINKMLKASAEDNCVCKALYEYRIGATGNALNKLLQDTAEIKNTLSDIENQIDTMHSDLSAQIGETQRELLDQATRKEEDDIWDTNNGIIDIGIVNAENKYKSMLNELSNLDKDATKDQINEIESNYMDEILTYLGIKKDGKITQSQINDFIYVIQKLNYEVVNTKTDSASDSLSDEENVIKVPSIEAKSCYVNAAYKAAKEKCPFSHQIYYYEKYVVNRVISQQVTLLNLYKECCQYLLNSNDNVVADYGKYMNDKYESIYNMTLNATNNVLVQVDQMNLMNPNDVQCSLTMNDGSKQDFYRVKMNEDGKMYYISKNSFNFSDFIQGKRWIKDSTYYHTITYNFTNKFENYKTTKGNTATMASNKDDLKSLFGQCAAANNYYNKPESFLNELGKLPNMQSADYILLNDFTSKEKKYTTSLPYTANTTEVTKWYEGNLADFKNYSDVSINTKKLKDNDIKNKKCKLILCDKNTAKDKTISANIQDTNIKMYKEENIINKSIVNTKRTDVNTNSKLNAGDTVVLSIPNENCSVKVTDENGKDIEVKTNRNNEYVFNMPYENVKIDIQENK